MFNIGDKVVPIKKSTGRSLDESTAWNKAKEINQDFLYYRGVYRGVDVEKGQSTHLASWYSYGGGDFFLESDLIAYIEDTEVSNEEPEVDEYALFSLQKLVDLHNLGILKGTDTFYVRRA